MAKLYAELTAHETARKVSKSSNTRLMLEVYEGNELIGILKAYPIIQKGGGHRITWQEFNGDYWTHKDRRSTKRGELDWDWIYSNSPKYLSASRAAMQPEPAAVTACR